MKTFYQMLQELETVPVAPQAAPLTTPQTTPTPLQKPNPNLTKIDGQIVFDPSKNWLTLTDDPNSATKASASFPLLPNQVAELRKALLRPNLGISPAIREVPH